MKKLSEKKIVALSLLMFSMSVDAAGYYRCTNANGNIVFSQTSCGEKAELITTEGTDLSRKPERKGLNVFEQLDAMQHIGGSSNKERSKKQTGVSKEKDPCKAVRPLQLRNARVGGDLMQCHTKDDVLSMYGKPNNQSTRSTGSGDEHVTWKYIYKDSSSLSVYFKNDKVTSWSKRH